MKFSKLSVVFICGLIFSSTVISHERECDKIEVPIVFDRQGTPTIELEINGHRSNALLDLGSSAGIHLSVENISRLSGIKYTGDSTRSTNIAGEVSYSKEFIVSELKLQCLTFENILGYELEPWSVSVGDRLDNMEDPKQAIIGMGFFKNKTIVIDYSNKKLTIKKNKDSSAVRKMDRRFKPYQLSKEGIAISINSAITSYQMVLDTGASASMFSATKFNMKEPLDACEYNLGPDVKCQLFTSELTIAGHPFKSNILLYPINASFTKDGLLGSDFFRKFVIELDFSTQSIAVTPSKVGVL